MLGRQKNIRLLGNCISHDVGEENLKFLSLLAAAIIGTSPVSPLNIIKNFDFTPQEKIIFSAELNISNGDPFTRDYGERGMFGKLVHCYDVKKNMGLYIGDSDRIYSEAIRLLIGPWKNGGSSQLRIVDVGKGYALDLENGKWVHSKGGKAIEVVHTTEYMNGKRKAYILIDEQTIWVRNER